MELNKEKLNKLLLQCDNCKTAKKIADLESKIEKMEEQKNKDDLEQWKKDNPEQWDKWEKGMVKANEFAKKWDKEHPVDNINVFTRMS